MRQSLFSPKNQNFSLRSKIFLLNFLIIIGFPATKKKKKVRQRIKQIQPIQGQHIILPLLSSFTRLCTVHKHTWSVTCFRYEFFFFYNRGLDLIGGVL